MISKKYQIPNSKFQIPIENRGSSIRLWRIGINLKSQLSNWKRGLLQNEVPRHGGESKGISLIELLIYIAILGSILVLILSLASVSLRFKGKTSDTLELSQNLRFTLERITLAIREATGVNSPTPGLVADSLSLKMLDPNSDPRLISNNLGVLTLKEGAATPLSLTSSQVEVVSFQVQNIQNPNAKEAITVTLELKSKVTGKKSLVKTTVSLRK